MSRKISRKLPMIIDMFEIFISFVVHFEKHASICLLLPLENVRFFRIIKRKEGSLVTKNRENVCLFKKALSI